MVKNTVRTFKTLEERAHVKYSYRNKMKLKLIITKKKIARIMSQEASVIPFLHQVGSHMFCSNSGPTSILLNLNDAK